MPNISSLFRNEYNEFDNAGARMLDSFYHMTSKYFEHHIFGTKHFDFAIIEPRHELSNNVVCATSTSSDQPAHTLVA